MRRRFQTYVFAAALLTSVAAAAAGIPPRPEQLKFPGLTFNVPDANAMRMELTNGIPVYAKPDRLLPLVSITVFFRGGRYTEPRGREGLADLAGTVWRTGGAADLTAQKLDEELDFLAVDLSTTIGDVSGSVRMNTLSKNLGKAADLLMDVLTQPRFQADRFAKAKDDLIQDMKKRNDDSADIERREWRRLVYGDDYWMNRLPTKASVDSITAEECKNFVGSLVHAGNIVVAVAGDFDRASMKALLDRTLGTLPKAAKPMPPVPQNAHMAAPGVYVVNKPDVNQGRVSVGQLGYKLGNPDEMALRVMNDILGGGGFTSWITKRVRSDEGLAYHAASYISFPTTYPGTFRALFQSKSRTCAGALAITTGLIKKIRSTDVSADELKTSKNSFVETFPRRFESPERTADLFALDELLGRPHGYWESYRGKIEKVTIKDVRRVAARDLDPDKMVILVVGNIADIMKGHPDYKAKLADFGPIHRVPLRDPLTLTPLTNDN